MFLPIDVFLNGGDKYESGAHEHMLQVLSEFDSKRYRFFMLNWARRHNKTTLAINIIIKEAWKNPNSVYLYVAPTYSQGKNIIWDDPDMLFSYLPQELIKRSSRQELIIELKNGSIIRIMGGDNPDRLRGINAKGIVFDEWAVFSHPKTIWQEIFLPILRKDSNRWAIFIFTPKGQNECYEMWLKAHENTTEWYTNELRASKAGIIPKSEYEKAKAETDPLLFAQEYECSFIGDEEMTFITSSMLEAIKDVDPKYPYVKKLISIDPALGGDCCPIFYMENYKVIKQNIGHWQDSKHIAAEAFVIGQEKGCKNYAVDYIGLGEGVYSRLNDFNQNVTACDVRTKANDTICYNMKASMWWFVRRLILDKKIPYPKDLKLRQQLCSVKFEFRNGLIIAEDKAKTKKRIGCSPDLADAYVQGIYEMWNNVKPEKVEDSFDFDDDYEDDNYIESACM